jgi:hypothetical protein
MCNLSRCGIIHIESVAGAVSSSTLHWRHDPDNGRARREPCWLSSHFEQTDEKEVLGGLLIIEPPPHFPIERLDTAWPNSMAKSVVPSYEDEEDSHTLP